MKEYYSTVDAAKICSVTRFSIINWAKKGTLKSTRTPGGHRRIHRADLIAFIKTYKIGLNAIGSEELISHTDFLRCWEFHSEGYPGYARGIRSSTCPEGRWRPVGASLDQPGVKKDCHNCKLCVVFLSDTKKCYTLREHVSHQKIFCKTSCLDCEYYKKIHFEETVR